MQVSLIIALSIVFFSSLADAKKCGIACPDINFGDVSTTIIEFVFLNLDQPGPSDGVCEHDKFIIDGSFYGKASKCVCLIIPKGKENMPGVGRRCPDTLLGEPNETLLDLDKRIYQAFHTSAPEDGWCPEGSIKWIISGKSIGESTDVCKCILDYKFYTPGGSNSSSNNSPSTPG